MNTAETLIEPGYLFSQHSLNTYVQCPRRFLLKYIDRQPWPLPKDQDPLSYQEHLARGRTFHQWLMRKQLGLDISPIVAACNDPQLQRWWLAAEGFDWDALPAGFRQPELPVVVPLGDYCLYARYDLLAATLEPETEAVVVDWKTLPVRLPDRVLSTRMQTRVYLYTLVAAGHVAIGGSPLHPAQVSMLYWFADFPADVCTVRYSPRSYEQDRRFLVELVNHIAHQPREAFVATERVSDCARCTYRGLCLADSDQPAISTAQNASLDEEADFDQEIAQAPELDY